MEKREKSARESLFLFANSGNRKTKLISCQIGMYRPIGVDRVGKVSLLF